MRETLQLERSEVEGVVVSRHDALKAEWQHGQYFETLVEGCTQWVAVGHGGLAPPLWDEHQEYRRRPDLEIKDCDDREACRLWIEAGMPQYLLSKPGTNHGIVRLIALARATAPGVTVLRHQAEAPADADDAGIGHE